MAVVGEIVAREIDILVTDEREIDGFAMFFRRFRVNVERRLHGALLADAGPPRLIRCPSPRRVCVTVRRHLGAQRNYIRVTRPSTTH